MGGGVETLNTETGRATQRQTVRLGFFPIGDQDVGGSVCRTVLSCLVSS